jgi:hypothetical protein
VIWALPYRWTDTIKRPPTMDYGTLLFLFGFASFIVSIGKIIISHNYRLWSIVLVHRRFSRVARRAKALPHAMQARRAFTLPGRGFSPEETLENYMLSSVGLKPCLISCKPARLSCHQQGVSTPKRTGVV